MRQMAKVLVLCLTAATSLLLVRPAASGSTPSIVDTTTHYWTYHLLTPIVMPTPIQVSDQFLPNLTPVQVDSLLRLVNWVRKNESTVRDTNIHFTWWNVVPKIPIGKTVVVRNQFGQFETRVENLEFLLAPAWKNLERTGLPPASHYLCYRAVGPAPTPPVSLIDEWRQDFQPVLTMEYLCAPCLKRHGLDFVPIDTTAHFALYGIHPISEVFVPLVQDQFVHLQMPVKQGGGGRVPLSEYLLVPSVKFEAPTSTKRTSWGKLKIRYR